MMKDYLGAIMVVAGIALIAIGGGFAYARGQYGTYKVGEVRITDAPSTVNQGESFTVGFEARLTVPDQGGTFTVKSYPRDDGTYWWTGSKDISLNSTSWQSYSMTVNAPTSDTGDKTLRLAGNRDYYTLKAMNDVTVRVISTGPNYYDLTVNSETGGTTSPSGTKSYEEGTLVKVVAAASSGYKFDRWSGARFSTANEITVTMDSDKTLTAKFSKVEQPSKYYLTTETEGQGSVSAEGTSPYDEGALVKVEATPNSGWKFDHWEEDISGTSNPTYVTMDSNKTVRAVFVEEQVPTYSLSTNVEGQGSISVSPERASYEEGIEVTLTAEPDDGYVFKKWRGDLAGSSNPMTVTMNSDKSVTAVFERKQPPKVTLTMKSSPTEGGSVTMLQSEKVQVTKGKTVTIQAYSNSGYTFDHWSGDMSGKSKSVTITMNADKTVTANFAEEKGIIDIIASNIQYVLMALGSVILIGGVVKIAR